MRRQSYKEVLAEIHGRSRFSSNADLSRISSLMEILGNPQDRFRCIHIAGTNGKGSAAAMVESALRRSGYRVGLFTSPHLVNFRERIQIDRQMIGETLLADLLDTVCSAEAGLVRRGMEPLNEFDLITAIGFLAFAAARVDYAVVEVGLGGRCDATNVLSRPEICAVTSISLDHTEVLGNTIEEIAGEKAGIFKPSCPVVLAKQEPAARGVLLRRAEALGCPVIETEKVFSLSVNQTGQEFLYRGQHLRIPLLGRYQAENAAAAWEICRLLDLREETVCAGFAEVSWPGRLQLISGEPDILIDACHNPEGTAALAETLDTLFCGREIVAVMAMMRDKDYKSCIALVASRVRCMIAVSVNLPRSLPPEELAEIAGGFCRTMTAESVEAGITAAKQNAPPNSLLLVCGSVYAAGAALQFLS